jgi:RNA polymerase sigma-70 factor (ECF subfamily)
VPIPLRSGRAVKATAGPSDEEVIGAIRAGDRNAFRVLVERYQARAYRLALRILRDEDAARDAVQDAFVKAYNNLGKFEQRSAFFTWLYRLVKNQCLDMLRRDRSDRVVDWEEGSLAEAEASADATPEVDSVSFAPATELQRKQLREHIDAAIAKLPESARETLILREVEGLSYQEIAEAQGIPKGTVMSRLFYARKQMQKLLIESGAVDAASMGEIDTEPAGESE